MRKSQSTIQITNERRKRDTYSAGFNVHFLRLLRSFRLWNQSFFALLTTLTAFISLLLSFGCGTTHATLDIVAPVNATAGTPFTISVTVLYQGQRDSAINSPIHFTSSDKAAILPADYYFTAADAGSHTWTNGVTLKTPGEQTISASIVMASGINGIAQVSVSSPNP